MLETKTFIYPHIPAMVGGLERWLSKKAEEGYELSGRKGWKFQFVKKSNAPKQYYVSTVYEFGNRASTNPFYSSKEKYADRNSLLWRSKDSNLQLDIFAVDENRVDSKFASAKYARNNYYKRYYIKRLWLWLAFSLASGVLFLVDYYKVALCLSFAYLMFLYNLISFMVLKINEKTNIKKNS